MLSFRRSNGRSPVADFLSSLDKPSRNKLKGEFMAVTIKGRSHENHQRFRALKDKGKPLWEFKEFDHRVYCCRICTGEKVECILLFGWTKQKSGKSREEDAAIASAKRLYDEYQLEKTG